MTPQSFREDLKRFDKRLDFVYNARKMQWEVVGHDLKGKKYLIKAIPIGQMETIGTWVLQDLYSMSPTKQGGAKELNRRLDDAIEEREKIQEKDNRNDMEGLHDEAYVRLKYGLGERVSLHQPERHETTFTVNDRRRVHDQEETI